MSTCTSVVIPALRSTCGPEVVAIEVTSSRRKDSLPGLQALPQALGHYRCLLVGGQGIPLDEFLLAPADYWLSQTG